MAQDRIEAGGLIYKDQIAMVGLIGIPTNPGIGGRYFSEIVDSGIHVELIVNLSDGNQHDHILICIPRSDLDTALAITEKIHQEVGSQSVIHNDQVALVCISSLNFDENQTIAGHMFATLGNAGINIEGISSSVSSVTCLIAASELPNAITALRDAFLLP